MYTFVGIVSVNNKIGFHEAELLVRTRYFSSFAPLYDIQIIPDIHNKGKMRTVPVGITAIQDTPLVRAGVGV